ncbi:hypothetical protein [Paenibacillus turpanensis]|uniref:hypothetical protein n=1 Tax=Paenibacillus turpanensis TaxID=2689078 RepID=UPI001407D588|nr:hypothetical protein [Paenibacillus turpanensis]
MITAFIIGCEIAFWLFVLGGLTLRYIVKKERASAIVLLCTPLIDVILLVVIVIHLRNGAEATFAHALAAVYIGASIGFGHRMIRWADTRFAHRFAGGPAPVRLTGKEHAHHERTGWFLHLLSWAIGCSILYGMVWLVNDPSRTEVLSQTLRLWSLILGIDFLISFSYTLWPRETKART